MVHARRVEEARANIKSRDAKKQNNLMEVLQREALRYKTNIGLSRGFIIKCLIIYLRLGMIGCLTLNSRGEKVLVDQLRSQLVESVVKRTMVITLREQIIALVVERVVTR